MTTSFKITNLTCEACVKLSNFALSKIPGVMSTSVDLETGMATMETHHEISWGDIVKALDSVGKTAEK